MGPLPGALRPTEPVEFPFVAWHRCFSLRRLACTSAAAGVSLFQRDRGAGLPTTCRLSSGCICFAAPESFIRRGESDRKSVVKGKSVSVRGNLGGRRIIKKKKKNKR